MKMAKIIGTGSYLPDKILTNKDLEKMVDTSDEWITKRTGIKERRIASENEASSDLGVKAAKKAVQDAGIDVQEIDLVICATVTPDMIFPATACLIQKKLGIKKTAAFDVEAACTGFITGLKIAEDMIKAEGVKNVLVVASEVLSRVTDWEDRSMCVLFGDGAGAAVLTLSDNSEGIISSDLGAEGKYGNLLKIPAGGSALPTSVDTVEKRLHFMQMRGKEVFKIAIKKMTQSARTSLKKADMSIDDVRMVIPHQANMRIIKALAKTLRVEMDRVYVNISKYGNMSAATTAIGLDDVRRKKLALPGEVIEIVAFGGGLTWGSMVVRI
ncbi:MAG: beta-ketoacyl-ACP synthase III [Elusimicrobiota bacterium]